MGGYASVPIEPDPKLVRNRHELLKQIRLNNLKLKPVIPDVKCGIELGFVPYIMEEHVPVFYGDVDEE